MTEKNVHQGLLVISRHAESEWNLLGKWTGLTDVNLTEKGMHESTMLGELLQDIDFDGAYTSDLKRTRQTLAGIIKGKKATITVEDASVRHHAALNERDYGDLTGKNKCAMAMFPHLRMRSAAQVYKFKSEDNLFGCG